MREVKYRACMFGAFCISSWGAHNILSSSPMHTEEKLQPCPICFSEGKKIDQLKTLDETSPLTVQLCECSRCKHWYINPLIDQATLSAWYAEGSPFVVSRINYQGTSQDNSSAQRLYDSIKKYLKPDFNYLEIGCESGNLLNFFSHKAHVSIGVEPGKWNADPHLQIVPDIDMLPSGIRYDCIVLCDVLEHVSDPRAMMKKIKQVANKDAIIYLQFPNSSSLKAKIQKAKWGMVLPFGHLHFFSSQSIDALCKNNFTIIKKEARRAGDGNWYTILKSFDWSLPRAPYRLIKFIVGQILLGNDQWFLLLRNV